MDPSAQAHILGRARSPGNFYLEQSTPCTRQLCVSGPLYPSEPLSLQWDVSEACHLFSVGPGGAWFCLPGSGVSFPPRPLQSYSCAPSVLVSSPDCAGRPCPPGLLREPKGVLLRTWGPAGSWGHGGILTAHRRKHRTRVRKHRACSAPHTPGASTTNQSGALPGR